MARRILFVIDLNNMTFAAQRTYSTEYGSLPVSLAVVDVNNDNKPDIIVANERGFNVGVLLNNGSGTFLSQTAYSTGHDSFPQCVSVVDVNGDDKPDILVANYGGNNVGVFFNSGYGTFGLRIDFPTGNRPTPTSVIGADVNNDKKADIIVANQNENNIGILLNPGNGMFNFVVIHPFGKDAAPISPSVVDINDDNKPDIIWADYNGNRVSVLFNFGNGTFHSPTNYSTGFESRPTFVSVVDVNGDDKPDIIVANKGGNNVGVFLNSGNGTFLPQSTYSTGNNASPQCVSVVDVNGDDKPEIIVANYNLNNIGILVNIGNGTFLLEKTYSTGPNSNPRFVSVVDVNDDDKLDIVVANSNMNTVGVMLAI
jgi:hypothetical protein